MSNLTPSLERRFIRETGTARVIADLAEPVLEGLGFRLVRVKTSGESGGTVQVMAERPGDQMTVDDCATISRELSPVLDAHDPLPGKYNLEVSSPGLDRPLVRPSEFETFLGYEAKVELSEAIDGRKRFRGVVDGAEDGEARLIVQLEKGAEAQVIGLPFSIIDEARLVSDKDTLREDLARSKSH